MRIAGFALLLLTIVAAGYAQEDVVESFGPIVTFSTKKAQNLTVNFYTRIAEKCALQVTTRFKSYPVADEAETSYHQIKLDVSKLDFLTYTIAGSSQKLTKVVGRISLPLMKGYKFAIYGNTAGSAEMNRKICSQMVWFTPVFLIHTGNIVKNPQSYSDWMGYFDSAETIMPYTAFMPVVGLADFYGPFWTKIFDVSNKRYSFYSYELPYLKVIVVNSCIYIAKDSAQYQWLEAELQEEMTRWKVVVFHHSPYSTVINGPDANLEAIKELVIPLLEKYKVNAVFYGQDSYYERSERNGIVYFSSPGCAYNLAQPGSGNPYRKKVVAGKNTFIIGDVSGSLLTFRAYDADNKVLDEAFLRR